MLRALWLAGQLGLGDFVLGRLIRTHTVAAGSDFMRFDPGPRDVIVSTFPKCGSNWMLQLAVQVAWAGEAEFDHIHELVPWPEVPLKTVPASIWDPPRSPSGHAVVKTHNRASSTPVNDAGRYIVVYRDPKDMLVSAYHFSSGIFRGILKGGYTPRQWLDAYLSGGFMMSSWAEHLASWWPLRDRENVLVLSFREMKADLPAVVDRVAAHMGVTLDADARAVVIEKAGFAHMKERDAAFCPMFVPLRAAPATMIRSGRVGGSGELYDRDERAAIDAFSRAELLRLGCDFPYDAAFGTTDG